MGEAEAYRRSKLLVWFSGNSILKKPFSIWVGRGYSWKWQDRRGENSSVSKKKKKKKKNWKYLKTEVIEKLILYFSVNLSCLCQFDISISGTNYPLDDHRRSRAKGPNEISINTRTRVFPNNHQLIYVLNMKWLKT